MVFHPLFRVYVDVSVDFCVDELRGDVGTDPYSVRGKIAVRFPVAVGSVRVGARRRRVRQPRSCDDTGAFSGVERMREDGGDFVAVL